MVVIEAGKTRAFTRPAEPAVRFTAFPGAGADANAAFDKVWTRGLAGANGVVVGVDTAAGFRAIPCKRPDSVCWL